MEIVRDRYLNKLIERKENGLVKYTYGETSNYDTIISIKNKLKKDFKDAFIIAFYNGKKITVSEAKKLQQTN